MQKKKTLNNICEIYFLSDGKNDVTFNLVLSLGLTIIYIVNINFSKWKGDSGSIHSICLCAQNHLLSSGRSIKLWDLETYSVLKVCQIEPCLYLIYYKMRYIILYNWRIEKIKNFDYILTLKIFF